MITKRTYLTPLSSNDFESLIDMYQDQEGNKYIPPLYNKTSSEYKEILKSKLKLNQQEVGFWTVRLTKTDELIGTVNMYYSDEFKLLHLGLHLKRAFWGKGFGKELMQFMVDFGFKERGYPIIHAIISEKHIASRNIFKSIGFTKLRSFREDEELINIYGIKKGSI